MPPSAFVPRWCRYSRRLGPLTGSKATAHCSYRKVAQTIFAALMLALTTVQAGTDADTSGNTTPSTSHQIPVRLGSVDAVRGGLSLSIPLGPNLPGRLPIGLVWRFDSQDSVQYRIGGSFKAVTWPVDALGLGGGYVPPSITVPVGASTYTFHRNFTPSSAVPSKDEFEALLRARGVGLDGTLFGISLKCPSSDGTKWYLETFSVAYEPDELGGKPIATSTHQKVILDGPNAIWTIDGKTTCFSNLWGDCVVAQELGGNGAAPTGIRIWNAKSNTEFVQLDLTLPETKSIFGYGKYQVYQVPQTPSASNLATVTISNGMGLSTVILKGIYRELITLAVDENTPGFIPNEWTVNCATTSFIWSTKYLDLAPTTAADPGGPGSTKYVDAPLAIPDSITYSNGMKETYRHSLPSIELGEGGSSNLSSKAFSPTGIWTGYKIGWPNTQGLPSGEQPNPSKLPGVTSVMTEDSGPGRFVQILQDGPTITKPPGSATFDWSKTTNTTWVLNYATAHPGSTESFRGVKIYHPSTNNVGTTAETVSTPSAFLFTTSAILAVERIRGNGVAGGLGTWPPGSLSVDQVSIMDGWDIRSWANPTGSFANALPVTAVATRTATYTTKLPTRIVRAGNRDSWGPTRTDEYHLPPDSQGLPAVDATSVGLWASALPSGETATIQRSGIITRHWDSVALELVTDSDEKTLSGTDLSALRGVGSVSFGQTSYAHEPGTAFLKETTGTREVAVAKETRVYVPGKPMLQEVSKGVTQGGAQLPFSGLIGTTYDYDQTPYQWLKTETDKLTGRATAYLRDALGRETLRTDANGVKVQTEYDGMGRVSSVTRLAKGAVGPVSTTYAYDPAGLWKTETVTADGRTLTTSTEFDLLGRVTKVILPDGSTQRTGYDGWGQKVWQTPVLKPGEDHRQNTWTYNEKGQVTASFDSQGRRLSSAYDPAVGPSSLWEPQWVDAEQRVVFKTWDDRHAPDGHYYLRQEKHDLLGQKREIIDQAEQLSSYTYDRDGHLARTYQDGQIRTYTYHPQMGWLTGRWEPEEGTTTYDNFTALGTPKYSRVMGRTGQLNVETTTALDAWHRPTQIDVTDGGVLVNRRTLTYRDDYNVPDTLTELQPTGTMSESYGYDDLARLNARTVSDPATGRSFSISRILDASGNPVSLSYPAGGGRAGQTVTTEYDSVNRPKTVRLDNVLRGQMTYGSATGNGWTDNLFYNNGASTASTMDRGELVSVIHQVMSGLPGNQQVNRMSWTAGGLLKTRGPNATPGDPSNDAFDYDALQRLSYVRTWGIGGELAKQWFRYDRWGNRELSDYTYATNGGMAKPDELMAWTASYDGGNRLPSLVNGLDPGSTGGGSGAGIVSGPLPTGVAYDDLGRIRSVNAIPGNVASQTLWRTDPMGRVAQETVNGVVTTFLLDGEGLRFKKMRADGWLQYTIYGFSREPLSVFEYTPTVVTSAQARAAALTSKKTLQPMAGVGEPVGAHIDAPAAGTVLYAGQAVSFSGSSNLGVTFTWTFGDGTTATGISVVKTYATPGTYTVMLKVAKVGAGTLGSAHTVGYTVVAPKPTISSFTASPATIAQGGGTTLAWTVTGATSLNLDNNIGGVTGTTSRAVSPGVTTTYTLSATNGSGTVTLPVTVTVVQPPAISTFSASPANIYQGDGSRLSWTVSGATGLSLDNGIGAVTGGYKDVSPSATTGYTLTATNTVNGVSVTRTASATVYVSPRPTVPSIDSFTADAGAIAAGTGTNLRWSVSNSVGAVTVAISNVGPVAQSGTQWVTPTNTLKYTLTATNSLDANKSVSLDVTVTVVNKPTITFSASPGTINVGSSSTLTWSVGNGPTTLAIDQGIGSIGASGSRNLSPGVTTTYTLSASNLAGTSTATATINVTQKPVVLSFTAASGQISQGASTTLTWATQGATSLTLNGALVTGTSLLVSPAQTTTYTLVATNSAGTANAATTITVVIPETFLWKKTLVYGFGTLISEEKPTGTCYVQGDQVGSPNIVTNDVGVVVGRSKNLPFGERFGQTGEKAFRRYTNHEDGDGSAIYMQARTYLPAYGKFAQVDPVYDQTKDDPESWNLYNYVTNNPVTHTDPDGRQATITATGAGGDRKTIDITDDQEKELKRTGKVTVDGATYVLPGGGQSFGSLPRFEVKAPSPRAQTGLEGRYAVPKEFQLGKEMSQAQLDNLVAQVDAKSPSFHEFITKAKELGAVEKIIIDSEGKLTGNTVGLYSQNDKTITIATRKLDKRDVLGSVAETLGHESRHAWAAGMVQKFGGVRLTSSLSGSMYVSGTDYSKHAVIAYLAHQGKLRPIDYSGNLLEQDAFFAGSVVSYETRNGRAFNWNTLSWSGK